MSEIDLLKEELEYFKNEKEKVRRIIGGIGGRSSRKRDRLINVLFLVVVASSFVFEVLRDTLRVGPAWFPPNVSLSLAILLVSVKIVWMIHIQSRIDHFQFWILNSIEFEINQISKRMRAIESRLQERETQGDEAVAPARRTPARAASLRGLRPRSRGPRPRQ